MRILLIIIIILSFVSPVYAWSWGSSWNQGDLDIGGYTLGGGALKLSERS